ncbi:MAG TPA: AMP-binding protein [Anaeromyxobacter sp.]|nr:AMP-binding protein [Anaeromyxobacter sp.]
MTLAVHEPGDLVAVGEGGPRTAADLVADAARVAKFLAGFPKGEVVLVCSDRYHLAVCLTGAWDAGHGVSFPPNVQVETIREVGSGEGVRAVLHDRDDAPGGMDIRELLRGSAPAAERTGPTPESARLTVMTSGTTGAHRGVSKRREQLLGEADVSARLFGPFSGERILSTVPPYHIYGFQFGVLLPLRSGAALVRAGGLHATEVLSAIERYGVTTLVSVPAHLAPLALEERAPFLRCVFSAGSPLPPATATALRARHGWRVVEVYGSTETGALGWREAGLEAWTPYPNTTISAGVGDSFWVDSPWLPEGGPRPYPLPDRIEMGPDGRFVLRGRRDDAVKVAGKRVSLREVEERLLSLPGVRDAAALSRGTSGLRGQEIWVAVAATGWTAEGLRAALERWLDPVTVPRRIRVLDSLPREGAGKLLRARLLELFDRPKGGRVALEPESEEVLSGKAGKEVRRLAFTVPGDLLYFEGHFPGSPVLPGVVELDRMAVRQVERLWPQAGMLRAVRRLKFLRPIGPGERIELFLERDPVRRTVDFAIEGRAGRCASGTLVFGPVEEP